MSRYAQSANLNIDPDLLIQLTDSSAATGVADMVLVERLGTEVDALIDGLLYGRYVTPLPLPVPAIMNVIAEDIWRMKLFQHRPTMEAPKDIVDDFKRSWALLKDYARGDELLASPRVVSPSDAGTATGGGSFSSDTCDRLFGRAKDFLG
jgi:phage gp36-like protein